MKHTKISATPSKTRKLKYTGTNKMYRKKIKAVKPKYGIIVDEVAKGYFGCEMFPPEQTDA